MLSNSAASIARNGIMFATTGDHARPFPSLPISDDERGTIGAHEHLPYSLNADDFPGWMLVSTDPRGYSYADDDWEAMDRSNFATIMGELGEFHETSDYRFSEYDYNEAMGAGALILDRIVLVAPIVGPNGTCGAWAPIEGEDDSPIVCTLALDHEGDHECHEDEDEDEDERGEIVSWEGDDRWDDHIARVERLVDLSNALADYPILDDDDYSQRECEAWNEWAESGGLQYDTMRDLREAGVDESVVDALDDSWSDVWPIAMQYTNGTNGFTGECSPDFHECVMEALARGTVRALVGRSVLVY